MPSLSSLLQRFPCNQSVWEQREKPKWWKSNSSLSHLNESNSGHRLSKHLRHASDVSIVSKAASISSLHGSQERSLSRRELDLTTSIGEDVPKMTYHETSTLLQTTKRMCRVVYESVLMPMMKTSGPDHEPHTDALATMTFYVSDVIELLTDCRPFCAKTSLDHPHKGNGSRNFRKKKCAFCALISILNTVTAVDGAYVAATFLCSNRYMSNLHGVSAWEATKVKAFWKLMMPASMSRSYGVESKNNCGLHMQNLLGCLSTIEANRGKR